MTCKNRFKEEKCAYNIMERKESEMSPLRLERKALIRECKPKLVNKLIELGNKKLDYTF